MISITTLLKNTWCWVHAELLFTDTDSLTYKIRSENVYEEFFKHKHLFYFTQPARDVPRTSPKVSIKALTSGTSREPSGYS